MSALNAHTAVGQQQQGFTLLELVLVLLILGLIAATPLVFIENQDGQMRYQQTLDKLEQIDRALLSKIQHGQQPLLTGFIVENGVLPVVASGSSVALMPLLNKDDDWNKSGSDDWQDYALVTPFYNGVASDAELPVYAIQKGYRPGGYIRKDRDSEGLLKDGWGYDFAVSSADDSYTYGYDPEQSGHPALTPYRQVVSQALASTAWQVPLSQLNLRLVNNSAETRTLALLVFRNAPVADNTARWTTYAFEVANSTAANSFDQALWWVNGTSTAVADLFVPVGLHPLLVVDDAMVPASAAEAVLQHHRLLVLPGATQPQIVLEEE